MQLEISDAIKFEAALERVSPLTQEALVRLRDGTKGFSFVNPDVDLNHEAPMGVSFELTENDIKELGTEPTVIMHGLFQRFGIGKKEANEIGFFWIRKWPVEKDGEEAERLQQSPRFMREIPDDNFFLPFHADIKVSTLYEHRTNAIPQQKKGRENSIEFILPEIVIPALLKDALNVKSYGSWWRQILERMAENLTYRGSEKGAIAKFLATLEETDPSEKIIVFLMDAFSRMSLDIQGRKDLAIGIINSSTEERLVDTFLEKHPEYITTVPTHTPEEGSITDWPNQGMSHRVNAKRKPASLDDPAIFYAFETPTLERFHDV